jgi:predicted transposase YbfD/YdcC
MGCQHKIADKIRGQNGHYVLALKGNQGTLHDDVKTYLNDTQTLKNSPTYTQTDGGHGRIETRTCTVSDDIAWLRQRHPAWQSVKTIVRIDSSREIKGLVVNETRYFVSSLPPDPRKILLAVRAHWSIENALHWSLDMTFADDAGRTRKDHTPANLATFRHFALNLLQKHKPPRGSIAGFRKKIGWDNHILKNIISNAFVI